jgi:hypothetical protein
LFVPQLGQRIPGSRVVAPVAAGASDAPQSMQKRASFGFMPPHCSQANVSAMLDILKSTPAGVFF